MAMIRKAFIPVLATVALSASFTLAAEVTKDSLAKVKENVDKKKAVLVDVLAMVGSTAGDLP